MCEGRRALRIPAQIGSERLGKPAHHQAHASLIWGNATAAQAASNIPTAAKAQAIRISGLILRNGPDSRAGADAIVPGFAVDMRPTLQTM
jgi:hypothetical protein